MKTKFQLLVVVLAHTSTCIKRIKPRTSTHTDTFELECEARQSYIATMKRRRRQ